MTASIRDVLFIAANAMIGLLIGFAVRAGTLTENSVVPPMMLIFVGMAAIELIAGYVVRVPLGQLVAMPMRFAALIVAFAGYLLAVNMATV